MVLLLKGLDEDDVARFWARLRARELQHAMEACGTAFGEERPFDWPTEWAGRDDRVVMLECLSEGLTHNRFKFRNVAGLSSGLKEEPEAVPLYASLPGASNERSIKRAFGALLGLIEDCPIDTPLGRLVLAVLVEDSTLVTHTNLIGRWKLGGYARTQVIELGRLQAIDPGHVKPWVEQHVHPWARDSGRTDLADWRAQELATHIHPPSIGPLRLRRFAERAQQALLSAPSGGHP